MVQVPAGWYADGRTATSMRYWDGAAWTAHLWDVPTTQPVRSPYATVTSLEEKRRKTRRDGILVACLLSAVALFCGGLWWLISHAPKDALTSDTAVTACERAAEQQLASRHADHFGGESFKKVNGNEFLIVGTVYAPNSFNAIVGQGFTCTATDVGNGKVQASATFVNG